MRKPTSTLPIVWSDTNKAYAAYLGKAEIASILIIKLDHIGDFLLAMDAFFVLRKAFSSAHITLACGPWNVALATALGIFDRIEKIEFFNSRADAPHIAPRLEALGSLGQLNFDLAIDLRVDPDTRVLLDHIRAVYKCGYSSHTCTQPMTFALPRPNVAQLDNLAINQRLMMLSLAHNVVDFFRPDAELGALLQQKFLIPPDLAFPCADDQPLVSLVTSSGRAAKNWPIENFTQLACWLCNEMGVRVILLGGKDDEASATAISDKCASPNLRSAVGLTSIGEAMSIIASSSLYIGNDTGLTHAAARMNVPTIALYSSIDPTAVFAPFGRDVTIISAPTDCAPCHILRSEQCTQNRKCVLSIDFEFVRSVVRRKLLWSPGKAKYGGLDVSDTKRLKPLEDANADTSRDAPHRAA